MGRSLVCLSLGWLGLLTLCSELTAQFPVIPKANTAVTKPADQAEIDAKALQSANVKADDPSALLDYIRKRTLSEESLAKVQAIIKRFQSEDFDERLKATEEVIQFGPSAISPLRVAANTEEDFEVAYRASECLKRLEKETSHTLVAAAVIRKLAELKPAATSSVLLPYLPLADTPEVADLIQETLTSVALREGKPDTALLSALKDASAIRRAAAAIALLTGGPTEQAIRIPAAFPTVKAAIAAEQDPETRFQMLQPLLTITRDKQGIDYLLEILPKLPRGRLWQAEDYLLQLAGKDAPKGVFGKSTASLEKARDQWASWWKSNSTKIELAKFEYKPRISGQSVLVMTDFRSGNPGYISILGPDMKERSRIAGLLGPMDVQFYPNGNMAIAEYNTNRVTIRDPNGKLIATRTIGGRPNQVYGNPQSVQILPNENLLITCRNVVVELKKDSDEQVMNYVRNNYDVTAAKRLSDGKTMVLLQNGPSHAIFLDGKGKELTEPKLKMGMPYYQAHIDVTGPDSVLVTELNQVVEYDLKTSKSLWKRQANQPRSAQRLPNGNTLIVEITNPNIQATRMVEYAPNGEEVWSFTPTSDFQVFRAYRR